MPVKIKIVSDGTPIGTKVIDEETGETINGVVSVGWNICVGTGFARAYIELLNIPVELVGEIKEGDDDR